jgi:hypothetical protein
MIGISVYSCFKLFLFNSSTPLLLVHTYLKDPPQSPHQLQQRRDMPETTTIVGSEEAQKKKPKRRSPKRKR